jgi:ATP-dependent Clp protease ATP-binding subunit ClpC
MLVNSNNQVTSWKPVLSENLKSAIEKSAIMASQFGYQFIGTEHFLYGLLAMQQNKARVILSKLGVDLYELEQNLLNVFENISKFPEIPENDNKAQSPQNPLNQTQKKPSALDYFTTDLGKKAS